MIYTTAGKMLSQKSSRRSFHILCNHIIQVRIWVGAAQKVVRDAGAMTYWIETPAEIGLQRVLDRDGHHLRDLMLKWQTHQDAHFQIDKTAENCDVKLTS